MTSTRTFFYLLTLSMSCFAKRPFTIHISEFSCILYGESILKIDCQLETIRNQTFVSIFLKLSEDVKAFQLEATTDLQRSLDSPAVKLFNLTLDGCKTLDAVSANNILNSFLEDARKMGNLPKRCPLQAKENYTITRYAPDADLLPLYTPEFSYITDLRFVVERKTALKVLVKGHVETKRKHMLMRNMGK